MKRISVKLAIGILTFLTGVVLTALWTFRKPITSESLRPQSVASAPIAICDLMQIPSRFESQIIRLEANLVGFHEPALYGFRCKQEDNYVRADFNVASRKQLIESMARLDGKDLHNGNFWVHVILSGRFEKIAEAELPSQMSNERRSFRFRYRLVVSSVEKVEPVSDDEPWW